MENESSSGVFNLQELNDFAYFRDLRMKMLKELDTRGLDDSKTMRLANEIMMAAESTINSAAANRLKHQDNMNREAIAEQVAMIIKETRKERMDMIALNAGVTKALPDVAIPVDTVPGEMEINPEPLNINDFKNERGD